MYQNCVVDVHWTLMTDDNYSVSAVTILLKRNEVPIMASGAATPGGLKANPPGGLQEPASGGINATNYRIFGSHNNMDPFGSVNSSGARVLQTRGVRNVRKDARATSVTYAWTLPTVPGGSTTAVGSIAGGTTQTATFLPDVAGTYVFRCTATFVTAGGNRTVVQNFSYTSA
jgi:hypothetical protein